MLVHVRALKPHFKSQIKPKVPDQQEKVPLPARPRVVHIVGHQKSIKSSPRLSAMSLRTLCKLNVNYQIECQNFIAGYHKHWGLCPFLAMLLNFPTLGPDLLTIGAVHLLDLKSIHNIHLYILSTRVSQKTQIRAQIRPNSIEGLGCDWARQI